MNCPTFFPVPEGYTYLMQAEEVDGQLVASVEFVGDKERRKLVFMGRRERRRRLSSLWPM
jgi:hypothetical protein